MSTYPTGTVTFLFTDIEGSTSRWEHQRQAMATALQRHDAILREAIETHAGAVFKTMGDAFYAVFRRAPDALEAALTAQRVLQSELWQEVGPIRVRMALHTGAAEERGGDYFGPPLNRVARLVVAAHGGQILLSHVTHELLRDHLPANVTLLDLGEHHLKDLIRPERIFQLVAPDLEKDFAPLKTLDNLPNNLPQQRTALIGREQEVAQVTERLLRPSVPLVTLTGPGGTGKTRLALQVAAETLPHFPDGAWFVNLAPITDVHVVLPTIAQALNLREEAGRALADTVRAYLSNKHLLLLLDNFEQVVEAAEEVAGLLDAAPGVKMLVTSRVPLHLYGEQEYPVPPLALPDRDHLPALERLSQYEAVRLFIERAQAVKPDFQITNHNAPAVAEICARLDGLPLAIELAAARSKLFTAEALLARLDKRLKVLTGGARNLPARQQTLRAAIEWSYNLLEEAEQMLFRKLAVFVGGRTLEAIEAICNAESDLALDPVEGVERLLDKSLLRQEEGLAGQPRFVMLETIHEYAREQLDLSGEAEVLQRAHANYYLALVEEAERYLTGPEQAAWFEQLGWEYHNIRTAFHWALDSGETEMSLRLAGGLWRFWHVRCYYREGREWLTTALARTGERTLPRAKALMGAGALASMQNRDQEARVLLEEALAIQHEQQDRDNIAVTLNWLGNAMQGLGHDQAAHTFYEESLAAAREVGDRQSIMKALTNLSVLDALLAWKEGDYGSARPRAKEALVLAREVGDKRSIGHFICWLGVLTCFEGNYTLAGSRFEEGFAIYRELGDKVGMAGSLNLQGVAEHQEGDYLRARAMYENSLTTLQEGQLAPWAFLPLANLGLLACTKGNYQVARALFDASIATGREVAWKLTFSHLLVCRGWLACLQEDYAVAHAVLTESLSIRKEFGFKWDIIESIEKLAYLALAEGELARTARLWGALHSLHHSHPLLPPPPFRRCHERNIAAAHVWFNATGWGEAWNEGRSMTLEEGIAYALGESNEAEMEERAH